MNDERAMVVPHSARNLESSASPHGSFRRRAAVIAGMQKIRLPLPDGWSTACLPPSMPQ
jgi:hypothetical protein